MALSEQSENWRSVVGYEGFYEVSDLGRIRRDAAAQPRNGWPRGAILKPWINAQGYLMIGLSVGGKVDTQLVHRLMLLAFVGPCPEGMEGCHGNGVRSDCRLDNLRWDTPKANQADSRKHGTHAFGEAHTNARLTEEAVRYIRSKPPETEEGLAKIFGCSPGTISSCKRMKSWRHVV